MGYNDWWEALEHDLQLKKLKLMYRISVIEMKARLSMKINTSSNNIDSESGMDVRSITLPNTTRTTARDCNTYIYIPH